MQPNQNLVRSIPLEQWPAADQKAWKTACLPSVRLTKGGRASHLAPITQNDLTRRYGYFLDHMLRCGALNPSSPAAAQVTPAAVDTYVGELRARVSTVTVYGSVCK